MAALDRSNEGTTTQPPAESAQKLSAEWMNHAVKAVSDANVAPKPATDTTNESKQVMVREQAQRLAPTTEKIGEALTPAIAKGLKDNGLETDPAKIRDGIADAIAGDKIPPSALQKRGDGDFPILDGYVGVGAITTAQRDQILQEQRTKRDQWSLDHADRPVADKFKQYPTGELLRAEFGKEKIDAADALLTKLQPSH